MLTVRIRKEQTTHERDARRETTKAKTMTVNNLILVVIVFEPRF